MYICFSYLNTENSLGSKMTKFYLTWCKSCIHLRGIRSFEWKGVQIVQMILSGSVECILKIPQAIYCPVVPQKGKEISKNWKDTIINSLFSSPCFALLKGRKSKNQGRSREVEHCGNKCYYMSEFEDGGNFVQ